MNRQTWTPIRPDGSYDEAESARPSNTSEPTFWEVPLPPVHGPRLGVMLAVQSLALLQPSSRFRLLFGPDAEMPGLDISRLLNVAVAVGPIATQAEADTILPALLAVKAAQREAVFAPTESIDLFRVASTGRDTDRNHIRYTDALKGYTYDGLYHTDEADAYTRHAKLDAVRVRGGETPMHPAWIRALRGQARGAGVLFSLAWGTWAPLREIPHSPTLIHTEMYCPFGPDGGVFTKQGPGWQCCTLDDVSYPEDH